MTAQQPAKRKETKPNKANFRPGQELAASNLLVFRGRADYSVRNTHDEPACQLGVIRSVSMPKVVSFLAADAACPREKGFFVLGNGLSIQ